MKQGIYFLFHPISFLGFAVLLMIASGRYCHLWEEAKDPIGLFIGTVAGIVFYYGTLAVIHQEIFAIKEYLQEVRRSFTHSRPPLRKIVFLGGRAIYEEAFWRGTVQVLLGNGIPALLLTAFFFTLRHIYLYYRRQPLATLLLLEFFLFSLLLGAFYLLSGRIMLVVAVHFIRNLLIAAGCSLSER